MEIAYWFLYILILVYIIAPVNTLVHEIGHAIPALLFGKSPVTITLGNGNRKWMFRLGRLSFSFSAVGGWIGFCRAEKMPTIRWKRVIIRLMGPVFSLLMAAIWWRLSLRDEVSVLSIDFMLRGASYAALFQFMMTIIPMRYGDWSPGYSGYQSDGLNILREFRPVRSASVTGK